MKITLNQQKFNYLNLSIAAIAILISLPSMINQIKQYFDDNERNKKTTVVYYSAPKLDKVSYPGADKCWGSQVSIRFDAYRCISRHSILDPCFWVEDYSAENISYFSCPKLDSQSENDYNIHVKEDQIERDYLQNSPAINLSSDLPWLIYIDDTTCRLSSGAVGIAYGNKGNIYSCESDKYTSVTSGEVKDEKHYFECKLKGTSVFTKCLAKQVVY